MSPARAASGVYQRADRSFTPQGFGTLCNALIASDHELVAVLRDLEQDPITPGLVGPSRAILDRLGLSTRADRGASG